MNFSIVLTGRATAILVLAWAQTSVTASSSDDSVHCSAGYYLESASLRSASAPCIAIGKGFWSPSFDNNRHSCQILPLYVAASVALPFAGTTDDVTGSERYRLREETERLSAFRDACERPGGSSLTFMETPPAMTSRRSTSHNSVYIPLEPFLSIFIVVMLAIFFTAIDRRANDNELELETLRAQTAQEIAALRKMLLDFQLKADRNCID